MQLYFKESPCLCATCSEGCVATDSRGTKYVSCYYFTDRRGVPNPPEIVSCSYYESRNMISLHKMEQMAYVIELDPKTKRIGFQPPKRDE